jgi:hypothetical protein
MTDLLLAWGPSGRSLPRFAAALSAWPMTLCPTSELLHNTLYQCVTAALQDMCATLLRSAEQDLAGRALDQQGTVSLPLFFLHPDRLVKQTGCEKVEPLQNTSEMFKGDKPPQSDTLEKPCFATAISCNRQIAVEGA